jgi:hypothetical protein
MTEEYLKQFGTAREQVRTTENSLLGQLVREFAEETIQEMKADVQKASGRMAASIGFDIEFEGEQFVVYFLADDYWDYLNSGVEGVQRSVGAIPNIKEGVIQSFKTLNPSPSMVEAFGGGANYGKNGEQGDMQNWMASKGIIAQDGDYNSLAYLLARATKRDGIEPSKFVTNAFSDERLMKFEQLLLEKLNEII